jgi:Ca2+-binding EF-hand superfamily protein
MRSHVFVAAVALALPLGGDSGLVATTEAQGRQGRGMRFAAMDANNDGRISKEEWRGSDTSFKVHDWNGDGVLSGDEVRVGAQRRTRIEEDFEPERLALRDWSPTRFTSIDRNRDGRVTRDEWFYDMEGFLRADRNRDNVLTRAEFLGGEIDDDREETFADLDRDRDGRVERTEWHGSREAFDWMDRNNDGVLSRAEVAGEQAPAERDLFASLDTNRSGSIERNEWQWSRVSFNGRDRNNDGVLSRNELGSTTAASAPSGVDPVGTAGRTVVVSARERWTDTGIVVRRGDVLTFHSDGNIQLSSNSNDTASPNGSASGRRAPDSPVNSHPAGGLIARIGTSAPVYVGDRANPLRAPVAGRLFLSVNDDHLEDNNGQFRVNITIQR